jgi:sugar/nucleoside kinase (ribokinase family)
VVFANSPEAQYVLAGGSSFPSTEWSVITAGARATTVTHISGEHRSIRPPPVDVVDSTGAGDSFAGAFIAAMLRNETPLQAVDAGHASSASTLLRLGAGSAHPAMKEL